MIVILFSTFHCAKEHDLDMVLDAVHVCDTQSTDPIHFFLYSVCSGERVPAKENKAPVVHSDTCH